MYDPTVGRFITEDPIGFLADDANLYRYARNSPLEQIDPAGTQGKPIVTDFENPNLSDWSWFWLGAGISPKKNR